MVLPIQFMRSKGPQDLIASLVNWTGTCVAGTAFGAGVGVVALAALRSLGVSWTVSGTLVGVPVAAATALSLIALTVTTTLGCALLFVVCKIYQAAVR